MKPIPDAGPPTESTQTTPIDHRDRRLAARPTDQHQPAGQARRRNRERERAAHGGTAAEQRAEDQVGHNAADDQQQQQRRRDLRRVAEALGQVRVPPEHGEHGRPGHGGEVDPEPEPPGRQPPGLAHLLQHPAAADRPVAPVSSAPGIDTAASVPAPGTARRPPGAAAAARRLSEIPPAIANVGPQPRPAEHERQRHGGDHVAGHPDEAGQRDQHRVAAGREPAGDQPEHGDVGHGVAARRAARGPAAPAGRTRRGRTAAARSP